MFVCFKVGTFLLASQCILILVRGVAGSDFHSSLCTNKNISLLSTNAQALSRHKSEVCQNVRLLVFCIKHTFKHILTEQQMVEKRKSDRLQCG